MKSSIAARFFCRKPARAAQMIICVRPTASFCVNSTRAPSRSFGLNENGITPGMTSAFFSSSIAPMFGNAASTTLTSLRSSMPFLRSMTRITMSTALPAALVASTLPFRSCTARMALSFWTKNSFV